MSSRLLLVEDDPLIGASLLRALTASGFAAVWASDGQSALASAAREPPDLVVLDLGLPDLDGDEVAQQLLRDRPSLPIIMLTARAQEADIVAGLSAGAVDYVTKPFRLAELLARVAAQLRAAEAAAGHRPRSAGDLRIDSGARRAWVGQRELALAPREFDLLDALTGAAGQVVPRTRLMAQVWGADWVGSPKTLDVHIGSLRRHLGEDPGGPSRIVAVRGVGYRFDPR